MILINTENKGAFMEIKKLGNRLTGANVAFVFDNSKNRMRFSYHGNGELKFFKYYHPDTVFIYNSSVIWR